MQKAARAEPEDSQVSDEDRDKNLPPHSGFGFINTGARYDPVEDQWTPIATGNAPSARGDSKSAAVWTGEAMLFFGGWNGGQHLRDTWLYAPPAAHR